MKKKIVILGGSGFLGKKLIKRFSDANYFVSIFSRTPGSVGKDVKADEIIEWKTDKIGYISEKLNGSYAVVNLAGATIAKKWTEEYKKIIYDSRINPTRVLAEAVNLAKWAPHCFISASGTDYYGDTGSKIINENNMAGRGFLENLCRDWESAAHTAALNTRVINMRMGIILDRKHGALPKLLLPFRLFAGGPLGDGSHWFPWIHIDDVVSLYFWAIENAEVKGAINAVSPNPVTMSEFCKNLGKVLHRPSLLKVPKSILTYLFGEFADYLLASHRVMPEYALSKGFSFKFPDAKAALKDICSSMY